MTPRFQADADFNQKIVRGIRRREPALDFQSAEVGGMIGVPDTEVLAKAAGFGRILVPTTVERCRRILAASCRSTQVLD